MTPSRFHTAFLLILVIGLIFYFVPTAVAAARHCRNTRMVFLINLLTGWTTVGWVVALVLAFGPTRDEPYSSMGESYARSLGLAPTKILLSPDGRHWWDGAAWQDTATSVPPHAPRSPDGYQWWDGTQWRPIPPPPA